MPVFELYDKIKQDYLQIIFKMWVKNVSFDFGNLKVSRQNTWLFIEHHLRHLHVRV